MKKESSRVRKEQKIVNDNRQPTQDTKNLFSGLHGEISANKNILALFLIFLGVYFFLSIVLPKWYQWQEVQYRDVPSAIGPLAMKRFGGDFIASYAAANALMEGLDIFANNRKYGERFNDVFAGRHSRYIYPPLVAYIHVPFALMPFQTAYSAWLFFNLILLTISLYLLSRLSETPCSAFIFLMMFYFTSSFLYFYLERGQSDIISFFFISLAFYYHKKQNKPLLCSLFFSLAALFKLYPALIGFYFLAHRQFRILAYSAAWSLLTVLLTGYQKWFDMVEALQRTLPSWQRWIFTSDRLLPYYYQEHSFATMVTNITSYRSVPFYILFYGIVAISLGVVFWEITQRGNNGALSVEISVLSILMVCLPTLAHSYNLVAIGFTALAAFSMVKNFRPLGLLHTALLAFLSAGPFLYIRTLFSSNLYEYVLLSMLIIQLVFLLFTAKD